MKAFHYSHAALALAFGLASLIWGIQNLHHAMTATPLERIGLENALGGGRSPEFFALRFVAFGLFALVVGGFDWHRTARRNRR